MANINWGSLIAGIITVGSVASTAAGHPALGAIISDPNTATALTSVVAGISGLWSAFAPSILHSTTVAAAKDIKYEDARTGK